MSERVSEIVLLSTRGHGDADESGEKLRDELTYRAELES
jgi:hypothetical protein